jgi:choline dehydrogenase
MIAEYDFIVVGSGAGGGPLACKLALAAEGYRVALVEAGTDVVQPETPAFFNYSVPALHARATEDSAMSWEFFVRHYSDANKHSKDYDSKFDKEKGGIFYPRAAALGGCTAHHAMVTVYPNNADWQKLRDLTGDDSWLPDKMRKYFQQLEDCQYVTPPPSGQDLARHGFNGWLPTSTPDPTLVVGDVQKIENLQNNNLLIILIYAFLAAHIDDAAPGALAQKPENVQGNFMGGLQKGLDLLLQGAAKAVAGRSGPDAATLERLRVEVDDFLAKMKSQKADAVKALIDEYVKRPDLLNLFRLALAQLDPNRWFPDDTERTGAYNTPASVLHGVRTGVRERILGVKELYPARLDLITGALVTQVIIEGDANDKRAVGVRFVKRAQIYQATPGAPESPRPPKVQEQEIRVRDRGEVILCAGAFNTPQLLMLSGIGPADHLKQMKVDAIHCDLPGVGQNLQDRREVALVSSFRDPFPVLDGAQFRAPGETNAHCGEDKPPPYDKVLDAWAKTHAGVYAGNGVVMTIIKRSTQATDKIPDLFLFGLPGNFHGYYRGYSCDLQSEKINDMPRKERHNRFTWVVLLAKPHGTGEVRLRDNNPLSRPEINFRYFEEGGADKEKWQGDVAALVEGLKFAEGIMNATTLNPTIEVPSDAQRKDIAALADFVQKESWGHHACGTCRIGGPKGKDLKPSTAVLDSGFRVLGVRNLRVADASVFPEIPGFFIVTAVYMIGEKAADVILQDRAAATPPKWPPPPPAM